MMVASDCIYLMNNKYLEYEVKAEERSPHALPSGSK